MLFLESGYSNTENKNILLFAVKENINYSAKKYNLTKTDTKKLAILKRSPLHTTKLYFSIG
jgi:hypothetical protein